MTIPSNERKRKTIRLQDFDYRQPGFYIATICVKDHRLMFGNIVNDKMQLNSVGQVALATWATLAQRFPGIELDAYIVMPNHVHGIIYLKEEQPILYKKPNTERVPERFKAYMQDAAKPYKRMPALWEIIRTFKAAATYRIHKTGTQEFAWQESYYESVLADERSLNNRRLYIANNPARWAEDSLNTKEGSLP